MAEMEGGGGDLLRRVLVAFPEQIQHRHMLVLFMSQNSSGGVGQESHCSYYFPLSSTASQKERKYAMLNGDDG